MDGRDGRSVDYSFSFYLIIKVFFLLKIMDFGSLSFFANRLPKHELNRSHFVQGIIDVEAIS